jgi:SAM-dependent methyltransferase
MERAEFDQFADEYLAQHRANIKVTGEDPEYFAEYKIAVLRGILDAAGKIPARIIDFGSGIGASVPWFRKYFARSALTCADASARSLELAQARFPGGEAYVEVAGDTLPAADAGFDLVFSACVFHHIDHAEHVRWLGELNRVTAPGGRLAIFEHNPYNPLTVRAVNTCPFDINARLIPARKLVAAARAAGWRDPQVRYHIFFPNFLKALRRFEPALGWLPLGGQYSMVASK